MPGPTQPTSIEVDAQKYRLEGESFEGKVFRIAAALSDSHGHQAALLDALSGMRFLPAGRVQSAAGSHRKVTAFNCFVSRTIEDSMDGIMTAAREAAETMRRGGGIGYDFSTLRPRGDLIKSLDSRSSGPISFMAIFDAICQTIASAGHRRGAQMGVLRIDHPDIEAFIQAKQNSNKLTGFNISIGVTDEFMMALKAGSPFPLRFKDQVYRTVDPRQLWDEIALANWDWAEPGVIFLDRINQMNNLWYCEEIAACNPCSEQSLPPHGACLLGSFNLAGYIGRDPDTGSRAFAWQALARDIPVVVRAMDNVIDRTEYPIPAQEIEAKAKRRMGLGVTGLANAGEALGFSYGSTVFLGFAESVLAFIRDKAYSASSILALEKGPFPLFDREKYPAGRFIQTLPSEIQSQIGRYGIRNSHLLSIAPTGTISLMADNVSSGIEPPFRLAYTRTIQTFDGPRETLVEDFAFREWGVKGKTAEELSAEEHLAVLASVQKYVDSAVSKTCNVSSEMPWEDFKELYTRAWELGCKGLSVFNPGGKRTGVLTESPAAEACYLDPETGMKECS